MKRKHLLIPITVLTLLTACISKQPSENTIVVDADQPPVSIHSLDLITDVEIIPLAHESLIMGEIDKVIRHDTLLYLLDGQRHAVHIYSDKGTHIKSIERRGNGRGEYQEVNDIFIDPMEGTLNILSCYDQKLLIFDLLGSRLPEVKKLPKRYRQMVKSAEGYLGYKGNQLFDEEHPYNFWLLDNACNVVEGYSEVDAVCMNSSHTSTYSFSHYKNEAHCITEKSYLINQFTNNKLTKKYLYDFGSMNLPEITHEQWRDINWINGEGLNYIRRFSYFQETNNHLLVQTLLARIGQNVLFVYNKHDKSSVVAALDTYMDKYFFSFGHIKGIDEQAIYTTIEATAMYRFWNGKDEYNNFEEKYPQQIANLRTRLKEVDRAGNPFLIIYAIK